MKATKSDIDSLRCSFLVLRLNSTCLVTFLLLHMKRVVFDADCSEFCLDELFMVRGQLFPASHHQHLIFSTLSIRKNGLAIPYDRVILIVRAEHGKIKEVFAEKSLHDSRHVPLISRRVAKEAAEKAAEAEADGEFAGFSGILGLQRQRGNRLTKRPTSCRKA